VITNYLAVPSQPPCYYTTIDVLYYKIIAFVQSQYLKITVFDLIRLGIKQNENIGSYIK